MTYLMSKAQQHTAVLICLGNTIDFSPDRFFKTSLPPGDVLYVSSIAKSVFLFIKEVRASL